MAKQKLFLFPLLFLVFVALVTVAFTRVVARAGEQESATVSAAALDGLKEIGWDVSGFSAETEAIDGAYARVLISSSNPPGGFTAYLQRQAEGWQVIAHGSAFNPAELAALGIPESVLP